MYRSSRSYQDAGSSPTDEEDGLLNFLVDEDSPSARTIFVGNLDRRVDRKLLYELFVQAGPIESIKLLPLRERNPKTFAFIKFEHASSSRYALLIFRDIALFHSTITLNYSGVYKNIHPPEFPEREPTFFEAPPSFSDLSESELSRLVANDVMPPASYRMGYPIRQSSRRSPSPKASRSGRGYNSSRQREENNSNRRRRPVDLDSEPESDSSADWERSHLSRGLGRNQKANYRNSGREEYETERYKGQYERNSDRQKKGSESGHKHRKLR